MAERSKGSQVGPGQKIVSMKLFATWEVEKSSPNCIPRICSLTLTRLMVMKPLENDLNSVIIAVKMQSSKRVLRSNEIYVPSGGVLDVDLDLFFNLQYPHFLKRDDNKLQIMLQRRKRYKNKQLLGYKTLAVGQLSMAQVLQHSIDRDLSLYADPKERTNCVARVKMVSISSQPVDHEDVHNGQRKHASSDVDRSPDVDNDSDEDEMEEDQENWSNDEMSDSEPMMLEQDGRPRPRKVSRGKIRPTTSRQRNIKQKFIALLKKFKMTEEVLDSEADHDLGDPDNNPGDIDDLFDELEALSDSEPELDTMSVMSTPKPRLRPFFTGRGSTNDSDRLAQDYGRTSDDNSSNSIAEKDTDPDINDLPGPSNESSTPEARKPPEVVISKPRSPSSNKPTQQLSRERSTSYKEKKAKKEHKHVERRSSVGGYGDLSPRKALLEQLGVVLGGADDRLPENLFLVNTAEWQGQLLVQKLQEKQMRLICTCSDADVRAALNFLVTKIQKFCNTNSKNPNAIKMGIAGGDSYINSVLRPFVEQFSAKSPDWQSYVRFLIIPFGVSVLGKYLASLDNTYNSLFMDSLWKDTFEKSEMSKLDSQELVNRVSKYMTSACNVVQVPIAEAMIMCKGKGTEEESSQIFVPFLSEVKIGTSDTLNASVDFDDVTAQAPILSSSPPMTLLDKQKEMNTPPNSPNVSSPNMFQSQPPLAISSPGEFMELQVDYWTVVNKAESTDKGDKTSKKDSNKNSLKTGFRSLHVCRLPASGVMTGETQSTSFSMVVVTREKKQKIRIGKKSKEAESKSQVIDGINRLICTSKSQNYALKVVVDGVEWTGVKFFQLSSQWQTHMKHFPVVVFSHPDSSYSIT